MSQQKAHSVDETPVLEHKSREGKSPTVAGRSGGTEKCPSETNGLLTAERDSVSQYPGSRRLSFIRRAVKDVRNHLSDLCQKNVAPGYVRVSSTCRCGERLRVEVAEHQHQAAIDLAQNAAGPNVSTVSSQISDLSSLTAVNSVSSASTGTSDSSASSGQGSESTSPPQSPNTASSDNEAIQPEPFIPAGTEKYMLLCVNTLTNGRPHIRLAKVEVTDVECAEEMFSRLQKAYRDLRGSWNPLLVPKTMHYVKFQLLHLKKTSECVANYQVNTIPLRKEVLSQEYAFSPCPPQVGQLPMPPHLFMHGFLDPGDHMGPMAVEMLPKKLWRRLGWDGRVHDHFNIPTAYGFYIVEGVNWPFMSWCAAVALLLVTALTVAWSVLAVDVQGGTGLCQYCLAVLAVSVSVYLLEHSVREGA
ncbi:hypothetical protein B0T24DRAFT_202892 [Lasiosphaeria ovina]|uniref:Uncharacterized protein n=1 Tax=Lasiosphaeria ovina TaxID=92902 RepID=A0AAE0KEX9_9PEZI|nr:hypothetical protein B0T24DRAFT_202892 [Lasiosphaeria ovina]